MKKRTRTPLLKPICALGCLLVFCFTAYGQQDPYLTHYNFNKLLVNPAFAGSKENICFSGVMHNQWLGLTDQTFQYHSDAEEKTFQDGVGAKTVGVTGSAPVFYRDAIKLGIGGSILQDNIGYEQSLKVRAAVSLHYLITKNAFISVGMDAGMLQKGINGAKFRMRDPDDPNIPKNQQFDNKPNFSGGIVYTNRKRSNLYIGLSTTNAINETYQYSGGNFSNVTSRHYYMISGMEKNGFLGKSGLVFSPSILLKLNSTFQTTLTGMMEYQSAFSGGVAYRTEADAASFLVGYRFANGMRVGYSYDFSINALRQFQNGTHELQFNYCIPLKVIRRKEISPRFLDMDPKTEDVLMHRKWTN